MSVDALKEKARAHERKEQWGKALELYQEALEQVREDEEPDISLFNRVGDLLVRVDRKQEALTSYQEAIDLYLQAELPNNAIAVCRKLIRNYPDHPSTFLRMGRIRGGQGFLTDARQNFLTYVEMMQARGKVEEAFEALIEFVALAPDDVGTRLTLARQLHSHGRTDEAVEQLTSAYRHQKQTGDEEGAAETEALLAEIDPGATLSQYDAKSGTIASEFPADEDAEPLQAGSLEGFERTSLHAAPSPSEEPEAEAEEDVDLEVDLEAAIEITSLSGEEEDPLEGSRDFEEEVEGVPSDFGDFGGEDDREGPAGEVEEEDEIEDVNVPLPMLALDDLEDEPDEPTEDGWEGEEDEEEEAWELPNEGLGVEEEDEAEVLDESLPVLSLAPGEGGVVVPSHDESQPPDGPEGRGETAVPLDREEAAEAPEAGLVAPELDPADHHGWRDLGEELLERGESEQAERALDRAHRGLAAVGEMRAAMRVVQTLLEHDPENLSYHQRRVEYAYQTHDRELLIPAILGLAKLLSRTGDDEQAQTVYRQLLAHDPENLEAKRALGLSEPPAPPASAPEPRSREVPPEEEYVDLGAMVLGTEEKTTRWVVPADAPSGDEEADFARMLTQFKQKVAENLEGEDSSAHYDLGTAYKEMGLLDEAISEFQQSLRLDSQNLAAFEMLGQCFLEKGKPGMAVRTLQRALRASYVIEDDLLGIYYYLGIALEEIGNTDESQEFYEKVFALDINFKDVTDRLRGLR